MKIAICDDMENDSITLKNKIMAIRNGDEIECFSSGHALLDALRSGREFDCLFIDIYLPDIHGTELVSHIQETFSSFNSSIVFITTSTDYAVEAFSLNAVHYIVKPVTSEEIIQVFERIYDSASRRKGLVIKTKSASRFIYFDEIATCESSGHKMIINLVNGESVFCYQTVSELQEQLDDTFLPVSRGIIVNADYIEEMRTKSCILKNNREILISRKNIKVIHDMYNEYIFSRLFTSMSQNNTR